VDVVKLPVNLACWLIKLVEDPQGTVEATLAKIKELPAYVKHTPAAFKEHINAIQAIEDPYEQGKAVGELVGKVLPVGGAVGKIASKLGRWGKVAKPKKRQERIGGKGGAEGSTIIEHADTVAAKTGTQGFKALGEAERGCDKVLQSGGQSLKPRTSKSLNLTKEQGRHAIHSLKDDLGLPNNFHGKIMSNGDYVHPSTGERLGNLFDYVY
jgi:hypothetical protein